MGIIFQTEHGMGTERSGEGLEADRVWWVDTHQQDVVIIWVGRLGEWNWGNIKESSTNPLGRGN